MNSKFDGQSLDIEQTEREKLATLFPQCFSEGKLDIDKLLNLCGEYIDEDFEKYTFEWKGKAECFRIAGKRSTGTLRPCQEESVNFDTTKNLYIEGDNLEVLKLLQTSYFRKVKMIYIDPPYNTGHDFVYEDDFADPMARYKEVTEQTTKSNPETMGRYHTNWLNMMYPRLRLAANLLRDDGVIFISIDDNEVHNLRKLCDEVFGEENFVADIIWQKKFSRSNDATYFSTMHDHIICYSKNNILRDPNGWKMGLLPRGEEIPIGYSNPDSDVRGAWTSVVLSAKSGSEKLLYEIQTPSGRICTPPSGRYWSVNKEKFSNLVSDNRIWFGINGDGIPRLKTFLSEVQDGLRPNTIWFHSEVGHNQEGKQELKALFDDVGVFDSPKPVKLLKNMMIIANLEPSDIILDFFSGSATTAHAVMQLNQEDGGNRKFIMVQLPEVCDEKSEAFKAGYTNICEIGKERIRRAGAKLTETDGQVALEESAPLDIGFRCLKLDTSNLVTWDATPIGEGNLQTLWDRFDELAETIKADRSDMDIVYEVMLKMGVPLDYPVFPIEVNGKKAYSVGEDCLLLVCLDHGITPEDIEAMCELAPAKIIAAEAGFEDDTALSNAHYILRDREIEMKLL